MMNSVYILPILILELISNIDCKVTFPWGGWYASCHQGAACTPSLGREMYHVKLHL